jgi:hypothetical protein
VLKVLNRLRLHIRRRFEYRAYGGRRCDYLLSVREHTTVMSLPSELWMTRYGEVMDVNMPRDKDTGKPKGFAFMMYEDQRSTVLAVDNLNGAKVLERTLRVDHVKNYKQKGTKGEDGEWIDAEEQSMNVKPEMIVGTWPILEAMRSRHVTEACLVQTTTALTQHLMCHLVQKSIPRILCTNTSSTSGRRRRRSRRRKRRSPSRSMWARPPRSVALVKRRRRRRRRKSGVRRLLALALGRSVRATSKRLSRSCCGNWKATVDHHDLVSARELVRLLVIAVAVVLLPEGLMPASGAPVRQDVKHPTHLAATIPAGPKTTMIDLAEDEDDDLSQPPDIN